VLSRIESLTEAQQAAMVAYREEWLRWGRCTDPADRQTAERVFRSMYRALGKSDPAIWWFDGPATGSMARALLTNSRDNLGVNLWANLRANLRANLWDNLGDNLGANLRANLWDNLGANLGASLRVNLGDNLSDTIWDALGSSLWANLRGDIGDNLRANLGGNLYWNFWGQHDAAWSAYYAWPDLALRPMYPDQDRERLSWWLDLARSCGWWHPYEGVVFACERPSRQAVDGAGRLHAEDGPALLCRDGFGVYAWHGVRVPESVILNPGAITPATISAESNAEVRRVMIERMGWDRYLAALGVQPVQSDRYGDLYRTTIDDAEVGVVVVTNGTPEPDGTFKRYSLLVPPEHQTAHAAVASTYGLTAEHYAPVGRT
jgi:hypothetical protein